MFITEKKIVTKSAIASILTYVGMYAVWIGLFALSSLIPRDIGFYVFIAVSCIISFKTCTVILERWRDGFIAMLLGIIFAVFAGLIMAPAVLAKKVRPYVFGFLSMLDIQNGSKDELLAVRDNLARYYQWLHTLTPEEYGSAVDRRPANQKIPYGCITYGDAEFLFGNVCDELEERFKVDCSALRGKK